MEDMVIFIVIGGIVIVILALVCCCCCCRNRNDGSDDSTEELQSQRDMTTLEKPEFHNDVAVSSRDEELGTQMGIEMTDDMKMPTMSFNEDPKSSLQCVESHVSHLEAQDLQNTTLSEEQQSTHENRNEENKKLVNESNSAVVDAASHSFDHQPNQTTDAKKEHIPSFKSSLTRSSFSIDDRIVEYDPETGSYKLNQRSSSNAKSFEEYRGKISRFDKLSSFQWPNSPKVRPYYWADGHMVKPYQDSKEKVTKGNTVLPVNGKVQDQLSLAKDYLELKDTIVPEVSLIPEKLPPIPVPDYNTQKLVHSPRAALIKERNFRGPYGLENLDDMNNPLTIAKR